jgi:hypothetical protein
MIKLLSVWCLSVCLCVRNSYLEILPSGTFFPREKNPAERHHTTSKNGQFCCRTRAPPSASFGNISAENQATKPALEPNWAPGFDAYCCRTTSPNSPVRISTGIPSTGLCFFFSRTIIITEVDDDGMITLLHNHPDSGRRFPRRPDDKGRNGGATMKAAAARRGRQRRRDDKGRNGGATTKAAAAC